MMKASKLAALGLVLAMLAATTQAIADSGTYRVGGRDVAYTLATPKDGANGAPIVILAHGLSGVAFYAPRFERWSRALSDAGFVVVAPQYFDSKLDAADPPEITAERFKAWRDALAAGVVEARRLTGSATPVGLVGFSLGGYLATAVSARDASVGAMVVQGSGLSSNIAEEPERMPAALLIHSTRDPTTPITEARKLETWLRAHGGSTQWLVIDGDEHIVQGEADAIALSATLVFLARQLRRDISDAAPPKPE